MKQEYYSLSETAKILSISEASVMRLTMDERLPICFDFEGELVMACEIGPKDERYEVGDIDFKGTLRCMQPPANEQRISGHTVLVSVMRFRGFRFSNRNGQKKRGYQAHTTEAHGGDMQPGYQMTAFLENIEVHFGKWLFHTNDIEKLVAAPGHGDHRRNTSEDKCEAVGNTETSLPLPPQAKIGDSEDRANKPWMDVDDRDPKYDQEWYVPARHFARLLVSKNRALLLNRLILADKVSKLMVTHKVFKRGGKFAPAASTILKAFTNVDLT